MQCWHGFVSVLGLFPVRSVSSCAAEAGFVTFYRNPWMRHLRFISRLKIVQVGCMVALTGPVSYWYSCGLIENSSLWMSVSAASASTVALALLSYFFRRIVGRLSHNESTKQVELATLTFWGQRHNQYFADDSIIPWSETVSRSSTHLFQRLELSDHQRTYVYSLRLGLVTDEHRFSRLMGFSKIKHTSSRGSTVGANKSCR
eukprot:m.311474 g.311474  ORF g.311474 m.311474 type:complete len:202 (+) comp72318_c0_seq1:72-677(+)